MLANGNKFIERSLANALSFLKESIFSNEYALQAGLLQSLDPRVKTATFALLIIQILVARNIMIILFLYALCLSLVLLSRISPGFFLKRTWVFIPLFSFFIALPAIFNVFTPGEALATLDILGIRLIITRQGLYGAGLFLARVVTSLSFVILLSLTTKHFELLKVLRIFKIPRIFVMTLGMCYRYVYLFVETIENTYLAIKSRVGTKIHYKKGQQIVAWHIASLWQRSYQLNEDVYRAMLARGYNGESLILHDFKIKAQDWLWACCIAAIFGGLLYLS